MKIISVCIENLNSLEGKFEIPFYPKNSLDETLCLISGPTGAGKSTIFDAICLGLYGKVPRLSSTGGKDDLSPVMTLGQQTCRACVRFQGNDGALYRAEWKQSYRKAHGGGQGDLMTDHNLYNDAGQILAISQHKGTATEIEALTGMTYDAFQRIVMLAQGEFTAFLTGNDAERTAILEKLTNTSIYRELSKAIYRKANEEEQKRGEIEANISELTAQLDEARDGRSADEFLAMRQEQEKDLKQKQERKSSLEKQGECLIEQQRLDETKRQLEQKKEEYQANRDAVARHESVLNCLSDKRFCRYTDSHRRLEECKANQPKLEADARLAAEQREVRKNGATKAVKCLEAEQVALNALRTTLIDVRRLDTEIGGLSKQFDEKKSVSAKRTAEVESCKRDLENATKERDKAQGEFESMEKWTREHQAFEGIGGIQGSCNAFISRYNEAKASVEQARQERKCLESSRKKAEARKAEAEKACARIEEEVQQAKAALDKAHQELEALKGGKDVATLRQDEASLGKQVEELQRLVSLRTQLEEAERRVSEAEAEVSRLQGEKSQAEAALQAVLNDKKAAADELQDSRQQLEKARLVLGEKLVALRAELKEGEPCPLCGSKEHHLEHLECLKDAALDLYKSRCKEAEECFLKIQNQEREQVDKNAWVKGLLEAAERALSSRRAEARAKRQPLDEAERVFSGAVQMDLEKLTNTCDELSKRKNAISDTIRRIDEAGATVQARQAELNKKIDDAKDKTTDRTEADSLLCKLENELKNWNGIAERVSGEMETAVSDIARAVEPLQLVPRSNETGWTEELLATLREMAEQWNGNERKKANAKERVVQQNTTLDALRQTLPKQEASAEEAQRDAEGIGNQLSAKKVCRQELFQDKSPDVEQQAAEDRFAAVQRKADQAKKAAQEAEVAATERQTLVTRNQAEIQVLSEQLPELEKQAHAALSEQGFLSEDELEAARLDAQSLEDRRNAIADFEQTRTKWQHDLQKNDARKASLATPEEWDVLAREDLAARKADVEHDIEALSQSLKELNQKEGLVKHLEETLKSEEEKKNHGFADLAILRELNQRFGSNSGNVLANLAQERTLEQLLQVSNAYMADIMPRYRLKRLLPEDTLRDNASRRETNREKANLSIGLVDHYHQDDIRMAETASGGEKFIISLALALGLSDLNSDKLKIQSLFLDEGFGALDENILGDVIGMLQRLRSSNAQQQRKIFIISHVKQLKEVIPEQILVNIVGDHKSTIQIGQ